MRLNNIHVSSKEPVNPSLWVDTSGKRPILKGYVNGQYVILSEDVPDNVITKDMIVNSLDSDAVDMPLSAAQGKILKSLLDEKQGALTPGTGVEITDDNTINVTLDTTVFKVVPSLPDSPASGDENKIHLVPSENTGESNSYKEYLWVNNEWEEIGTYMSTVDLTLYLTREDAEKTYQKITDSSLQTQDKTVVGGINEVSTELKEVVKPYVINLTNLLSAQDSESISAAVGGIDNLNGTVQKNQVIFGTLANGTVAVGLRVLGNQTTLTYFVDSVVGLTVNEVIITNTSGTLTKIANTHAVLTENMVINSLNSDETTLPLSAAQGKALDSKISGSAPAPYIIDGSIFDKVSPTSEEIDTAIGGWDNLVAAIQASRIVAIVTHSNSADSFIIPNVVLSSESEFVQFTISISDASKVRAITNALLGSIVKVGGNLMIQTLEGQALTKEVDYNSLTTTDKTVLGAINENTGNVTRINRAVGNPVIEDIEVTIADSGKFWNTEGYKKNHPNFNISNIISLEKGDLLQVYLINSSVTTSLITKVSATGEFIESVVPATAVSGRRWFNYLADNNCYVQLSVYGTPVSGNYRVVKSHFNTAISDNSYMQYLHKVYEEYGAVYNKETGYWELNGLTDLTEEDMWDIYLWTSNLINQPNLDNAFYGSPIRTTFTPPIKSIYRNAKGCSLNQACLNCASLEVFNINRISDTQLALSNEGTVMHKAFYGCVKLRRIKTVLYIGGSNSASLFTDAFSNCAELSYVKIRGLKQAVSFGDSPLLSYESLNYLVTNAANTAAITVTVHPTTYSYLTGTAQPTEEVGGTTEEWQALVTTAQGKQISFAQPAETQSEVTE